MIPTRPLASLAATALLAGSLTACGGDRGAGTVTTSQPAATTSTTGPGPAGTTTTAPDEEQQRVLSVYFLRGEKLAVGTARQPATEGVAGDALQHLLGGPDQAESGLGFTSAIPRGTRLRGVSVAGGVARVDLSEEFRSGGGSLSMQARLAQVVFTTTQFRGFDAVRLLIEGREVDTLGGEGLSVGRPLRRDDFSFGGDFGDAALLPPVLVETPRLGDDVTSPLRITGSANVFEATFQVEVLDGDRRVVAAETVTATSGSGQRGTFDVTVRFSGAARGRGAIRTFVHSARDGSRQDELEVPVTFR